MHPRQLRAVRSRVCSGPGWK